MHEGRGLSDTWSEMDMNEDIEEEQRGVHRHPNSNAEGNDACLQVACCVESGRAT